MARTSKGNLRGRAAATERRELRDRLFDEADKERIAQEVREIEEENDARRRCIALESESSFYAWFNDDANVPPFGPRKERVEMIEESIKSLEHAKSVKQESESV